MPSDPKRRGKRTPKPTFHGNRYTKKVRIDCNETTESVESDKEVNSDQECSKSDESKPEAQTTPTRSAMKLYNMYGVSKSVCDSSEDSSDSDCGDTDNDVSDDGTEETHNQDLHGYRLIDVDILNRNILSQLSCAFCHSEVSLFKRGGEERFGKQICFHVQKQEL